MGRKRIDHSQTICKDCQRIGDYHAKGLCKACYHKAHWALYGTNLPRTEPIGICSECHTEAKIHARGICNNCYQKDWRKANPSDRKPGRPPVDHSQTQCIICGKIGGYHARGQCKTCYYASIQANLSPEEKQKRAEATARWNEQNRKRYLQNKQRSNLRRLYNLSVEEYEALKTAQNGACAICKEEKPLGVDHEHATGRVRGLLCSRCNFLVGHFEEAGPDIEERAKRLLGWIE